MSLERLRRELQHTMKLLEDRRGRLVHCLCSPALGRSSHKAQRSSEEVKRPNTAAVLVGRSSRCERVQQLQRESTRCPSLEPGRSATHCKAPPWRKHSAATQPLVPFLAGPGYILSRNKSKFDVSKGTCHRDLTPEEEEQLRLQAQAEREVLTAQLQQQISDLTLHLEEERLNHRQTKQRAEEYLRDRLDQLDKQHNEHTREVKARHKEEALKQKTEQDSEFNEYQTTTENHIRQLTKEVEQLQGAFEAYKSVLQDEMHAKWLALETQLKAQCDQAVHAATQDMKDKMAREKVADRTEAVKEQRRAIETLRKDHKKDMDNVFRKYSREAAEMERLQRTTVELTEAQKELEERKSRYRDSSNQLAIATHDLTDLKVQLMDFEERFQEKVTEVDDKYKNKLHQLVSQNSQLRTKYMDKCGQVLDQQTSSNIRVMQQVRSAMAAMECQMESKAKGSDSNLGPTHPSSRLGRPPSAPGTPRETQTAHLIAGEMEFPRKGELFRPDLIMASQQDPETDPEQPARQEVLASGVS